MITPASDLLKIIKTGKADQYFTSLYNHNSLAAEKQRYRRLLELLENDIPHAELLMVSSPGRTELGGNHTDHNNGCVLAGGIDLDCVIAVTPVDRPEITLCSEQYSRPIRVNTAGLTPRQEEEGKAEALVRGVAAATYQLTGKSAGFYGWVHSTCQAGKGISSSAAFSIMVGGVINFLHCGGALTPLELARIAHEAENSYFGKPCGMMDQMASGYGGTIFIDFQDPEEPLTHHIDSHMAESRYRLAIIDTGSSHAELTGEYAAIREEMQAAAAVFGQEFARGITMEMALSSLREIRRTAGDRAALRLIHFIEENDRARLMAKHLEEGDFNSYLGLVEASGTSSCTLLQNCIVPTASRDQGILVAITAAKRICPEGVYRVHGGGFGGTIQAYVPEDLFDTFGHAMARIFGKDSIMQVQLGRPGVCGLGGEGFIATPAI